MISSYYLLNGNYKFFGSCRYLASEYFSSSSIWNRNINIFATLGLIIKHEIPDGTVNEINQAVKKAKYGDEMSKYRDIQFYSLPLYDNKLFNEADKIAEKMLIRGFRAESFNKIFLIKAFNQEFADKIFLDNRHISDYSRYVENEIEKYIIFEVDRKGYVTKNHGYRMKIYYN